MSGGVGESFSISHAYRASQTNKSGIPAGPTVSIDQTVSCFGFVGALPILKVASAGVQVALQFLSVS
jgi:hypothetical protein